jgi:hypothetical protein
MKVIKVVVASLSLIAVWVNYSSAQIPPTAQEIYISQPQVNPPLARKFDEFELIRPYSECDIKTRLDYFAENGLVHEPDSRGFIIFYQSRRHPERWTYVTTRYYLIEVLGTPANRIEAIYGGYRNNATFELWLVPSGADVPKPTQTSYRKRNRRR